MTTTPQFETITDDAEATAFDVLIVGTGFAGIGLATQLKRHGIDNFVVIERAGEVGGTWRDNTYPGAACDIQSHLYSFSFRPNPNWSRTYATQPEIFEYLRDTVQAEALVPHINFNCELLASTWNDQEELWEVRTTNGTFRTRILIAASGHLSDPKFPEIAGIKDFKGHIFHSARWNHEVPLDDARIGIVGTGASAIQIVPALAPQVQNITVFQRTAPHIIPRYERPFTEAEKRMFARIPETAQELRNQLFWANESRFPQRRLVPEFVQSISQVAERHRHTQVANPELLAKITPNFTIGCKRVLISNDWYPALARENVHLETTGIERVVEDGVIDLDGTKHKLDVLIFSTGFEATDLPIAHRLTGRGGVLLADQWSQGGQAYASTTVHNFPNMFIMNGPNSGLGAGSVVYIIENQVNYILGAVRHFKEIGLATLEITEDKERSYVEDVNRRAEGTVWLSGGCASWYVDPRSGRLTTLWPDMMNRYHAENGTFSPDPYIVRNQAESVSV